MYFLKKSSPITGPEKARKHSVMLLFFVILVWPLYSQADDDDDDFAEIAEEQIEAMIEAVIESAIEDNDGYDDIEEQIEEAVEASIESAIEDNSNIENQIEDSITSSIDDLIEENSDDGQTEEQIENAIDDDIDDDDLARSDDDFDNDDDLEGSDDDDTESFNNGFNADNVTELIGYGEALENNNFELSQDTLGNEIVKGELLVSITENDIPSLLAAGFSIKNIETFNGLNMVVAQVVAPTLKNNKTQPFTLKNKLSYNHIFYSEASSSSNVSTGDLPHNLQSMPAHSASATPSIGVIDTNLDSSHIVIKNISLKIKNFSAKGQYQPKEHGATIVSILAGSSDEYMGLLPKANIYLASVFYEDLHHQRKATTVSLVSALNWLVENNVPVVNMSLTGPANELLNQAIKSARSQGTIVVSAVGNAGPNSQALFPSAYAEVVAVTAVSKKKTVYRLANRGYHIDFSAPGVNVLHAGPEQQFISSSGTSIAVPFVSAALALACGEYQTPCPIDKILKQYINTAIDLGPPGVDRIYGNGLINP